MVRNNKVISDLKDPRGWTVENNPRPRDFYDTPHKLKYGSEDYRDYFEYDKEGLFEKVCHMCILRAKYGSGNCRDGGDYFICLPKEVREGKVAYVKPVVTKQSKLM